MKLEEEELVDKLVAFANTKVVVNKLVIRCRIGEKQSSSPPFSIVWWDGTISDQDGSAGSRKTATFQNQRLNLVSFPRIGFASYALTEEQSIQCFSEMRNIVYGAFPQSITNRVVEKPFEPTLGDVPLREGNFYLTGGFAQLAWKYTVPMVLF